MGNRTSKPDELFMQDRTELIVCAFVRDIQSALSDVMIPKELVMIIHDYYKAPSQCLMIWSGTYKFRGKQTKHNDIKFVMMNTDSGANDSALQSLTYQLNVKDLSNIQDTSTSSLTRSDTFDVLQCGHSIACNVNIPAWFTKQHPLISRHSDYRMLIRIGGEPSAMGKRCDITLFDAIAVQQQHRYKNDVDEEQNTEIEINAYHARLPDLPINTAHTSSIYHNDCILTVGGLGDNHSNRAFELKFNTESQSEWKWNTCSKLSYPQTYGVRLCGIQGDNVLIIGGFEPPNSSDHVTMYRVGEQDDGSAEAKKVDDSVPNLSIARYKPGCCYNAETQRVFVGGGYNTAKPAKNTVEFLDLNKCDKWREIGDRTKETHMFSPIVWVAEHNPNIVYIAGDEVGDHRFSFLRSIEMYDLRDSDPWRTWRVFKDMFDEPSSDDWRSRALLAFTV